MVKLPRGLVAAGNSETARAAALILEDGGNAFDAVIAALLMACVSEPVLCSPGGGGFLMAKQGDSEPELIDFFAQTPSKASSGENLDFEEITADFGTIHQTFHIGQGSVATPGFVAGLFECHRRFASLPMPVLAEPAVDLAKRGHALDPFQAYIMQVVSPIILRSSETRQIYAKTERAGRTRPLAAGEPLQNSQLADTLEALCREGPDLFYKGEIASQIVEAQKEGGLLQHRDLANYSVETRMPLRSRFGDADLSTNPVPSSGGTLIALQLKLLQAQNGAAADSTHRSLARIEAMATTARLRERSGFDLSPSQSTVKAILDDAHVADYRAAVEGRASKVGGTTHVSVVDANGNLAAATTSNGEGCGHVIPGTGIMLNNMLGEEDINPGGFFNWRKNSRISSMMAPSILTHPDGTMTALGSGGSNRIRTALFQVIDNLVALQLGEVDAVSAPRLHFENDMLHIEAGHSPEITSALAKAYPAHHQWDDANLYFGGVHVASIGHRGMVGAADHRRGGVALKV